MSTTTFNAERWNVREGLKRPVEYDPRCHESEGNGPGIDSWGRLFYLFNFVYSKGVPALPELDPGSPSQGVTRKAGLGPHSKKSMKAFGDGGGFVIEVYDIIIQNFVGHCLLSSEGKEKNVSRSFGGTQTLENRGRIMSGRSGSIAASAGKYGSSIPTRQSIERRSLYSKQNVPRSVGHRHASGRRVDLFVGAERNVKTLGATIESG